MQLNILKINKITQTSEKVISRQNQITHKLRSNAPIELYRKDLLYRHCYYLLILQNTLHLFDSKYLSLSSCLFDREGGTEGYFRLYVEKSVLRSV